MPFGQDRYLPLLNAARVDKVIGAPDLLPKLPEVQEEFRKVFEFLYKLEGRLGTILLLNDVTVNGTVTAEGLSSSGTVNASTSMSTGTFEDTSGSLAPAVSTAGAGRIYFDSTSNTYRVSQNAGAFVDLLGTTAPSYGRWCMTATAVGVGSFVWDGEDANTGEYSRQAGNTQIVINYTGAAVVMAQLVLVNMAIVDAVVAMQQNGAPISSGLVQVTGGTVGVGAITSAIAVTSGDVIEMTNSNFDRFGSPTRFTTVSIFRIG